MKQLGPTELKRLHRSWQRTVTERLAVLLDDVQSPFNVGAIARTAAAFRIDHLYLASSTPSPASAKAGKAALGTHRHLAWSTLPSGPEAVDAAHHDGYLVVAVELADGAVPLHELTLSNDDVCLAVGHEDHGLSSATLARCDRVAYIPQLGRVGSLNVATAAAIAIYELRRRAWTRPNPKG